MNIYKTRLWDLIAIDASIAHKKYIFFKGLVKRINALWLFEKVFSIILTIIAISFFTVHNLRGIRSQEIDFVLLDILSLCANFLSLMLFLLQVRQMYLKQMSDGYICLAQNVEIFNDVILEKYATPSDIEIEMKSRAIAPENSLKDLIEVTDISNDTYGESIVSIGKRRQIYIDWYNVSKEKKYDTFCINFFNGEDASVHNLIPLKDSVVGKRHFDRKCHEYEIDEAMFETFNTIKEKTKANVLLLQTFAVRNKYASNPDVIYHSLMMLWRHIASMLSDSKYAFVYCVNTTYANEIILKSMGFKFYGNKTKHGRKILELRFDDTNNDDLQYRARNIIDKIREEIRLKSNYNIFD